LNKEQEAESVAGPLKLSLRYTLVYSLLVLTVTLASHQVTFAFAAGAIIGSSYLCFSIWLYQIIVAAMIGVSENKLAAAIALLVKLPILFIVLYLVYLFGVSFGRGLASGLLVHLAAFIHYGCVRASRD